jgi:hypothetical protein
MGFISIAKLPLVKTQAKSLSGNHYLGEDGLSASELDERQVILGFLLPTHQ